MSAVIQPTCLNGCRPFVCLAILALALQPLRESQSAEVPEAPKIKKTRVETIPLSDQELVKMANRAFVGVAESVQVSSEKIGESGTANVMTVTFKVEKVLFDETKSIKPNEPLVVRMYADVSRKIDRGDKVLWFLSPESRLGLTQPVGIDSGYFRYVDDGKALVNLKHNKGLVNTMAIENNLDDLASGVPADQRAQFKTKAMAWANRAKQSKSGEPIPVDLFMARVSELKTEFKKQD